MVEERTSPPPPPPPAADPPRADRELRRSRDNRVIAGVASGLGRYFDIDPVVVRIAFIVLTVFGGSGVILYFVAWLLIAKEGEHDSPAGRALKGDDRPRGRRVAAVVLIVIAVLALGGPLIWFSQFTFGDDLFFPLVLIAGGLALLLWPDEPTRFTGPPAPASPPVEHERAADVTGSRSTDLVPAPTGYPAPADPGLAIDSGGGSDGPGDAHPVVGDELEPPPPPEEDRSRFPIGSVTVAVIMVVTGIAVLLDRGDVINVQPAGLLATWLVIVGIGLVVSAFVGRSVGLIVLGILILPFLWFATVVDIVWWSGTGEEVVIVTDVAQLQEEYRHGIGRLVVDLSALELGADDEIDLAIGLSIGEMIVKVPGETEVAIDLEGDIGELTVERPGQDMRDDGFNLEIDTVLPGPNGRLNLDLDIGIGDASVELAA